MRDDLLLVLDSLRETLRDQRDRALLLLGFAGGFRRSELVGMERAEIEIVRQGLIVTIRRGKTDQEATGCRIGIPPRSHPPLSRCGGRGVAVSLRHRHWPAISPDHPARPSGREPPDRQRRVGPAARTSGSGRDRPRRLFWPQPAGWLCHISGTGRGLPPENLRQTGHASDAMLARYVREGELFTGNAAGVLLQVITRCNPEGFRAEIVRWSTLRAISSFWIIWTVSLPTLADSQRAIFRMIQAPA